MLTATRTLVVSVIVGLASEAMKAESSEVLQDVFASAVAKTSTSFASMTAALKPEWAITIDVSLWNSSCLDSANNFSALSACLRNYEMKCISLKDVTSLFNISSNTNLSRQDVVNMSPALVYSLLSCDDKQLSEMALLQNITETFRNITEKDVKSSAAESWGYSILFVTIINLSSLTGAVVLPCMKMKSYKLVLMFMVALAVGTLSGSSLLFLIPEAFLLTHDDSWDYIWKSSTIMGGIYLFYITEKIMRMINSRRENTKLKKNRDELATEGTITASFRRIPIDNSIPGKDVTQIAGNIGDICIIQSNPHSSLHSSSSSDFAGPNTSTTDDRSIEEFSIFNSGAGDSHVPSPSDKPISNGLDHQHHHHHSHGPTEIAPVAYMIIFGDALHNFIDGLSIGSAFSQSIMTGISVSVAVLCEELPHELGDFAILLNSGMIFRKALLYNFLSACTCYLGTIIGILLAENTASHEWIFAVAGGMFLYISLVDMMPEMNSAAETEEGKQFGEKNTFILQNFGLLTGFTIMLIFALYGRNIRF